MPAAARKLRGDVADGSRSERLEPLEAALVQAQVRACEDVLAVLDLRVQRGALAERLAGLEVDQRADDVCRTQIDGEPEVSGRRARRLDAQQRGDGNEGHRRDHREVPARSVFGKPATTVSGACTPAQPVGLKPAQDAVQIRGVVGSGRVRQFQPDSSDDRPVGGGFTEQHVARPPVSCSASTLGGGRALRHPPAPRHEVFPDELDDLLVLGRPAALHPQRFPEREVHRLGGVDLPEVLEARAVPQASVLSASGMTGTCARFASLMPIELKAAGSNSADRVFWGKTTIEIPDFSRSTPPSRTAFKSSRGLVRPTTIGLRARMRCPKIGYSTRDFLTTKATGFNGWMIVGSTKASSVLMWFPMKTQGPSSRLK